MNEVIEILDFIKSNPNCDTSTIDYNTVLDLHNMGYIEGVDVSTISETSFMNLRINIYGNEYLKSLKNSETERKHAANKTKQPSETIHNPRQKALYRIAEGVFIGVLILFVAWIIGHYYGLVI